MRIEAVYTKLQPGDENAPLLATPEPGARLGRPVRFALARPAAGRPNGRGANGMGSPRPAGYAIASVFVEIDHVRAARAVARGEACTQADVSSSRGEVGAVLLQRLPGLGEIVGAKAVRDVMADEVITRAVVAVPPMVRSGDTVSVRVAGDGVSVEGQAVATQSGSAGDTIRVINRDSRRSLKARVVGPGEVEVLQ